MSTEFEAAERRLHELLRTSDGSTRHLHLFFTRAPQTAVVPATKADGEVRVARDVFTTILGGDIEIVAPAEDPPDCIVVHAGQRWSVEVGALHDPTRIEALRHESDLFAVMNQHAHLLPNGYRIGLVLWDSAKPSDVVSAHPTIAKWLEAIFIYRDAAASRFVLNQYSADRPARGIFPRRAEAARLALEIVDLIRRLPPEQDFVATHREVTPHRAQAAAGRVDVADKLRYTDCHADYLVLHNYVPSGSDAGELWHCYWHDRDEILEMARRLAVHGQHGFSEVLFADYSEAIGACVVYRLWNRDGAPLVRLGTTEAVTHR